MVPEREMRRVSEGVIEAQAEADAANSAAAAAAPATGEGAADEQVPGGATCLTVLV